MAVEARDRRRRARRVRLEGEGERIRLGGEGSARSGEDLELVAGPLGHSRHEQLPDAVARVQPHRMSAPVPAVPVAHHADPPRIGRPHRENHAVDALQAPWVGAELVPDAIVGALAQEVQIVSGQRGGEAVGILDLVGMAAAVGDAETVGRR